LRSSTAVRCEPRCNSEPRCARMQTGMQNGPVTCPKCPRSVPEVSPKCLPEVTPRSVQQTLKPSALARPPLARPCRGLWAGAPPPPEPVSPDVCTRKCLWRACESSTATRRRRRIEGASAAILRSSASPAGDMSWTRLGHVLEISWICRGHVLDMSWKSLGHVLDMPRRGPMLAQLRRAVKDGHDLVRSRAISCAVKNGQRHLAVSRKCLGGVSEVSKCLGSALQARRQRRSAGRPPWTRTARGRAAYRAEHEIARDRSRSLEIARDRSRAALRRGVHRAFRDSESRRLLCGGGGCVPGLSFES